MRGFSKRIVRHNHVTPLGPHHLLGPTAHHTHIQHALLGHSRCMALCTPRAHAATSAHTPASTQGTDQSASTWKIDPRRLPCTIPGMTQEELAARMEAQHAATMQAAAAAALARSKSAPTVGSSAAQTSPHSIGVAEMHHPDTILTREVEVMRRALPAEQFAEYVRQVEKVQRSEAMERVKVASMSPAQLHVYQRKQRRRRVRYEWFKSLMLLTACIGTGAAVLSLFAFFY